MGFFSKFGKGSKQAKDKAPEANIGDAPAMETVGMEQLSPEYLPEDNAEPRAQFKFQGNPEATPRQASPAPTVLAALALAVAIGGNGYLYLQFSEQLKAMEETVSQASATVAGMGQTVDAKIAQATASYPKKLQDGTEAVKKELLQTMKQEMDTLHAKIDELEKRRAVAAAPTKPAKKRKK